MAIGINTNVPGLNAQRSLSGISNGLATAAERITSGKRINSASDDASGLAIAQRLKTLGQGYMTAQRNANDGISLAQTAEGSLGVVTDSLQRIRELALQAANGSLNGSDRESLQSEANALKSEIGQVLETSNFGGVNILNEAVELNFQVGPNAGDSISVSIDNMSDQLNDQGVSGIDISTVEGAQSAISAIDSALESVSSMRSDLGAVQSRFESTISNLSNNHLNAEAARSRVEDADIAKELTNFIQNQIKEKAGLAMLGQANQNPNIVLSLLTGGKK